MEAETIRGVLGRHFEQAIWLDDGMDGSSCKHEHKGEQGRRTMKNMA